MLQEESSDVSLFEVGPRDGLQGRAAFVPTEMKVEMIKRLVEAGLDRIEVTSFVNPASVPQTKDAAEVCAVLPRKEGVRYVALVANQIGLDRALAAGIEEISIAASASDAFSRANIGKSIDESLEEYRLIAARAYQSGMLVRGYVSMAFHCPHEGYIEPVRVLDVARRLIDLGAYEVSLADTIGAASPHDVSELLSVLVPAVGTDALALHLHDTHGNALGNVMRAYEHKPGIRTFDASIGGLGGCPFAKSVVGNVATEDVVDLFEKKTISTGIDLSALVEASRFMEGVLGHELPSQYLRSLRSKN